MWSPVYSSPGSRVAVCALVVANLLVLVPVVTGRVSTGDLLVVYWIENVAVWAFSLVKVATARGEATDRRSAAAAAAAYGVVTAVHGGCVWLLATDSSVHPGSWLLAGLALVAVHALSLVLNWFGRGERDTVTPQQAAAAPFPRMVVLTLAVLGIFWILIINDTLPLEGSIGPALILVLVKTQMDVVLHGAERRRAAAAPAAG